MLQFCDEEILQESNYTKMSLQFLFGRSVFHWPIGQNVVLVLCNL